MSATTDTLFAQEQMTPPRSQKQPGKEHASILFDHEPTKLTNTPFTMNNMPFNNERSGPIGSTQRERWFAQLQQQSRPRVERAVRNKWVGLDREGVRTLYNKAFTQAFLYLHRGGSFHSIEDTIQWLLRKADELQRTGY